MRTPQLMRVGFALALATAGCRGGGTQPDTNRTARDVASDVKVQTQKVAAKAGEELSDGWITVKIQSKFVADHEIAASDVMVSSNDGVVTLTGRVQNEAMRSLAVAIARNTDGVKQVVDQLAVMVAGPTAPPAASPGAIATAGAAATENGASADDATIVSGIQAKYSLDDKVKGRRIAVSSSDGIVTLRGEVGGDDERAQALLLARTTQGVQRVEDNLTVVVEQQGGAASSSGTAGASPQPVGTPVFDDAAITSTFQTKLSSAGLGANAAIEVTARQGVLWLEGVAPTSAAKQQILGVARETEGVTQVVDRIRIGARAK